MELRPLAKVARCDHENLTAVSSFKHVLFSLSYFLVDGFCLKTYLTYFLINGFEHQPDS